MTAPAPGPLDLPPAFLRRNTQEPAWLAALPGLVADLAARWQITTGPHFPGIAFNYVAPATCADGTPAVFKVSRHVDETRNEIAALRLWDGDGACRLLAADEERGALLVERLVPGTMLDEVAAVDDDAATRITAGLLRRLWRPLPDLHGFRPLATWLAAYDRHRDALSQGADGFPTALYRRADALRRDLLASTPMPTALHGDVHHFNVLRAQRAPWLAIDPKGLAGDPCFDVCQFLKNPHIVHLEDPLAVPPALLRRRLAIFCDELGLDPIRVRAWTIVHAMLDAIWDYEDGEPWGRNIAYAERVLTL